MSTLLLRLSAPLQSWGTDSKFDVRRTLSFPTKSGVIGMIASAMGYSREDSPEELNRLKFGIRADHEGKLMRDYHTAIPEKGDPYTTNRYYLADAVFLAGLESDDTDKLREIENALKNPAHPIFLGRRSCPPTMPLVIGIREKDLLTALKTEPWLLEEWRQKKIYDEESRKLRIITDSDKDGNGSVIRDVAVSFNPVQRKFGWRNVRDCGYIYMQTATEDTEHNPMAELE